LFFRLSFLFWFPRWLHLGFEVESVLERVKKHQELKSLLCGKRGRRPGCAA
jgi:hypothetical protein